VYRGRTGPAFHLESERRPGKDRISAKKMKRRAVEQVTEESESQ